MTRHSRRGFIARSAVTGAMAIEGGVLLATRAAQAVGLSSADLVADGYRMTVGERT